MEDNSTGLLNSIPKSKYREQHMELININSGIEKADRYQSTDGYSTFEESSNKVYHAERKPTNKYQNLNDEQDDIEEFPQNKFNSQQNFQLQNKNQNQNQNQILNQSIYSSTQSSQYPSQNFQQQQQQQFQQQQIPQQFQVIQYGDPEYNKVKSEIKNNVKQNQMNSQFNLTQSTFNPMASKVQTQFQQQSTLQQVCNYCATPQLIPCNAKKFMCYNCRNVNKLDDNSENFQTINAQSYKTGNQQQQSGTSQFSSFYTQGPMNGNCLTQQVQQQQSPQKQNQNLNNQNQPGSSQNQYVQQQNQLLNHYNSTIQQQNPSQINQNQNQQQQNQVKQKQNQNQQPQQYFQGISNSNKIFKMFICGKCQANVIYEVGASQFIQCGKCSTINKTPYEENKNQDQSLYLTQQNNNNSVGLGITQSQFQTIQANDTTMNSTFDDLQSESNLNENQQEIKKSAYPWLGGQKKQQD